MAMFLLAAAAFYLFILRAKGASFHSPGVLFLTAWIVIFTFYTLPLVKFQEPLTIATVVFVLGALSAFSIGSLLALKAQRVEPPIGFHDLRLTSGPLFPTLAIIALAYSVQTLFTPQGMLLLTDLSQALNVSRSQSWQQFYRESVSVSPTKAFAMSGAFAMAVLLPVFWLQKRQRLIVLSVVSLAALVLESFVQAGRFTLGTLALGLAISTYLVSPKRIALRPLQVFGVGVLLVYFFAVFPSQRNPDLVDRVDLYMAHLANAEIHPVVKEISQLTGVQTLEIVAYSTSYFSQPLHNLNYFVSNRELFPSWQLGLYNLPILSQIGSVFSSEMQPWQRIRFDIAAIMREQGLAPNPWATGLRDMAMDFGILGTIFLLGILGFASQKVTNMTKHHPALEVRLLSIIVAVGAFILPFVSWFQVRLLVNTLILCVLALILVRVLAPYLRGGRSFARATQRK